jgi:hypothetical protein
MARLIITGGFGKPFRYEVEEGETVVGRETDVDLVLPNNSVSRKHAKLIREGDELRVQDLGSRNGVQVNGNRVESAILTAGDVLAIGRFQLTRVSPSEPLFEGRYIVYLDEYSPAATSSRNKTITQDELEKTGSTPPLGPARIEVQGSPERFWRLSTDPVTFGGDGLVDVGGLFSGGVVADILLDGPGALLTKRKMLASVKFDGKSVKSVLVKPGETFQVGDATFIFKLV